MITTDRDLHYSPNLSRRTVLEKVVRLAAYASLPHEKTHLQTRNEIDRHLEGLGAKSTGYFLERIDTPDAPLFESNSSEKFEGASSNKAFVLAHLMTRINQGQASFEQPITIARNYEGSCAVGSEQGIFTFSIPLHEAARSMMQDSENAMTDVIIHEFGGYDALENTTDKIGAKNSRIQHEIGCTPSPTTPNLTTLEDLGRTYAYMFDNPNFPENLRMTALRLMASYQKFPDIVHLVRQGAGSTALANRFFALSEFVCKDGSYNLAPDPHILDVQFHRSLAGYFKTPDGKKFVFGTFINGAKNDLRANVALSASLQALLRVEISQSLRTL